MRKAGFLAFLLASSLGLAQGVVFLSTQLRPIEEAQKMRQVILKGFSGQVQFVPEDYPVWLNRVLAEAQYQAEYEKQQAMLAKELRFIERHKGDVPVGRHRLRCAQQPARVGGEDTLFAGDQADMLCAFDADNAVIHFACQKAQREAHDAAGMGT